MNLDDKAGNSRRGNGIDADFSPKHPSNVEAAQELGLRYDPVRGAYVDGDGCPTLDRFGQPLG